MKKKVLVSAPVQAAVDHFDAVANNAKSDEQDMRKAFVAFATQVQHEPNGRELITDRLLILGFEPRWEALAQTLSSEFSQIVATTGAQTTLSPA